MKYTPNVGDTVRHKKTGERGEVQSFDGPNGPLLVKGRGGEVTNWSLDDTEPADAD